MSQSSNAHIFKVSLYNYHLSKMILLYIFALVTTLVKGQQISAAPVPKCQTGFFYKTLPLIADESSIINLDQLFNGYNLQYSLKDQDQFKAYITLGDKVKLLNKQIPDMPLIGLKNYHIQKIGNNWGSTFIALTQRSQRTFVHYGVLNSNTSAPVVNSYISVENFTNTTCYDAVLFPSKDLILVDCAVKLQRPNSKGQMLENIFYYHRISNGSLIRTMKTEMYVNFKQINRRKLQIYSDLFNQHTFLLRTYLADGLDLANQKNSYVDVFMIADPNDPWIVQVIDRSFLKTKVLSIVDIRIYLGQIFILDNNLGVYRIYINTEQDLMKKGFYQAKGFNRFAVFSNNLDDHFQLALANSHSVYEIDWTNIDQPTLINKYSLMPDSKVSQVFLNQRFVFIQAQSVDSNTTYNYTWIMNRGDRTYTKAFKVIKHGSDKTLIDVNQDLSYLIIFDDIQLTNYAIDQANLIIKIKKDQDLLDNMNSFKVIAKSKDQMGPAQQNCQLVINFTLLQDNNRTMWPIGQAPPSDYTANYPGKVLIRLHQYVLGPNVTYRIHETDKDKIKQQKIYQQQQLKIIWDKQPPFDNITVRFLRTQTLNRLNQKNDSMMIYMQDQQNFTYFVNCTPDHQNTNVTCTLSQTREFVGEINNWGTTRFLNRYTLRHSHIMAYTTTRHFNLVYVIDADKKEQVNQINVGRGFAGNTTSIAVTGQELYIVVKYIKSVQIVDLQLCLQGICQPKCVLDHLKMYKLGVLFFSPTTVDSSVFHPNVIFIKSSVQIIIVDYNKECSPKLLGVVSPVDLAQVQFTFKVNAEYLIVTIQSQNLVLEYDIKRLFVGEIRLTKKFPLYGSKLPKVYDLDVSNYGNCVYVTMGNDAGDYQVFVYRTGYPAVGSLYDVIDLYSFKGVMVSSTGFQVDYVSVYSNQEFRIFRQYEQPLAQIYSPNSNYSFYLQYFNPSSHSSLQLINVQIINLPTQIKVNPFLNDIMNTRDLLFSGKNRVSQINDTNWWQGNVLRIQADCADCKNQNPKVKMNNHIQHQNSETLIPSITQFQWSYKGGTIQAGDQILNMYHNGTVRQFVNLPKQQPQICRSIAVGFQSDYEVSACNTGKNINLYLVSFISQKGFAFEPFPTTAKNILKLESLNDLIILVDVQQSNGFVRGEPGGIYLYGINQDDQFPTGLIQVQYINGDDLALDDISDFYIGNAQLTYHQQSLTYRLYITQMTKGLFIIDFKYSASRTDITIRQITYVDLRALLVTLKYQLPYDAVYQGVTLMQSVYDSNLKKTVQKVLITTSKFHTIQLTLQFDLNGLLKKDYISRLYNRYAYYQVQNYIKHHNGLFVISQILPEQYQIKNQSKQLLTVYSTRGQFNGTAQVRGFLGAYVINDFNLHKFDFNLTFNSDGHSEPRIGMVLVQSFRDTLQKFSLHQNLSVVTSQKIDTQIIYIDLINDFSLQKIRILLNGNSPFPQWKLITIILFSIIGLFLLVGGGIIGFKKIKAKRNEYSQNEEEGRDSLMTGNGSNTTYSRESTSRSSYMME